MQLAKKLNVSQKAIDFWEKGINEPKASNIKKLADYFQISTDELLGRESSVTGNIEIKSDFYLTEEE